MSESLIDQIPTQRSVTILQRGRRSSTSVIGTRSLPEQYGMDLIESVYLIIMMIMATFFLDNIYQNEHIECIPLVLVEK